MKQKVNTVNTIEVSSLCNNDCVYCPASFQGEHREVGLMSMEIFKKSLQWVVECGKAGTQQELNLFGIGEPTLNPDLCEMIRMARKVLPLRSAVHINTNGKTMTKELAIDLKNAGISHIDITGHNAYDAANCIRILKGIGIKGELSMDFMSFPNNWAGQVDWFEPDYRYDCPWLFSGQVMIMSNGDVTNCCIDAFGQGVFGNVADGLPKDYEFGPMPLCDTCHQNVPVWMSRKRLIIGEKL